jgi:Fungal pheromone mating factor STE2 GPCR
VNIAGLAQIIHLLPFYVLLVHSQSLLQSQSNINLHSTQLPLNLDLNPSTSLRDHRHDPLPDTPPLTAIVLARQLKMSEFPQFEIGKNFSVPPDFDPVSQPVWYLLQNGTVHEPFTFDRIDAEIFYVAQWSLVYGCTIGAAVMTLLHVLALTPITKRRTLIFWLNVIGLCQVLARGIVASLYYTRDRFQTLYVILSGDSTSVPPLHRFHSTFSVFLSVTSIATVEVIFFVQGRSILSSLPRKVYFGVISALVLFGLIAVTARLIYAVYNIQDIWVWNHVDRDTTLVPRWCEPLSE